MKRMLINATQPEELRVALVDGQSIYDFDIEQVGQERKKANIYKGRVSRAEQSLGAAFVDFGSEKHGFLPIKEVAPQYQKNKNGKNEINECFSQGQEIIVQVEKEERGTKGAAISTYISLPGHYLVLMPNSPEAGGISKSIEGASRDEMRKKMRDLEIPEGMGAILRTAGEGVSQEELQWDLDYLLNLWDAIQEASEIKKAPFLIYRENDLVSRSLRDFLRSDITEVLVDTDEAYEKAFEFTSKLMPDFEDRIKRYDESVPLFTRYQIESQIETAYQREVSLPSGGSIVIDQTEALVAIDINSAKSTKGRDIEETAVNTNLESAVEIAKQLRLRDMGGLIVIDFIDMLSLKNKRAVEDKLWTALSVDRAKVQVGRISRFGLMEMSRQRLRPSLQERWTQDVASLSTAVLRLIDEESAKKRSGEVRAVVSPDMSIFLLNERRPRVNEIEERTGVRIVVVSDPTRSDNRFEVTRLRDDDKKLKDSASYEIQDQVESTQQQISNNKKKVRIESPAVNIKPPKKPKRKKDGFIKRLLKSLTSSKEEEKIVPKKSNNQRRNNRRPNQNRNQSRPNQNNTRNNNRDNKTPDNRKKTDNKKPISPKPQSKDEKEKQENRANNKTQTRPSSNSTRKNPEAAPRKATAPRTRKPSSKENNQGSNSNKEIDGNKISSEVQMITEADGNRVDGKTTKKTVPLKEVEENLNSNDVSISASEIKEPAIDKEIVKEKEVKAPRAPRAPRTPRAAKESDAEKEVKTPRAPRAAKEAKEAKEVKEVNTTKEVETPLEVKVPKVKKTENLDSAKTAPKENNEVKTKDRGRASNDPRNKK